MLSKIIEIVFPCFFFYNDLLLDLCVIHFLYSKNLKKKSMRWEKSVRAYNNLSGLVTVRSCTVA